MIASTAAIPVVRPGDEAAAIAAFASLASFETTHPSAADIEGLAARWPMGTAVYVSAVPSRPPVEQIDAAIRLRGLGFTPVPHLAARNFATSDELDRWLARMSEEAQVHTVLVIGGDREAPAGLFHHAVEAIDSGLLQTHGITAIGIAGYPDGHARISQVELQRALAGKIEAAEQTGLAVHIVTQFAFTAAPIVAWIRRLRDDGFEQPVRVGLAGPASLASLARFARICGVKSSLQGLARNAGLVKHVFGTAAPDELLRALAGEASAGHLGEVTPHFYSFGGLAATARWAAAVAGGRITLDRDEGFSVAPP
ncbi:methylenetetrahydrofolate reductase [Xanthobacteraceae bacterium Astr-EGSB]|uniref:methylenetetrahydrofolate reductase n=1 Tax=Astrobacterium formosum TaxID=3069710 RepID=UPI0027B01CCD|nr:methylenetetrahydrofolate reductase [Xanthobacteraceae bacterium Astr-EGSB]